MFFYRAWKKEYEDIEQWKILVWNGMGEEDLKEGGHRWGTERGRRWLDLMSGMNGFITIKKIKKMYDSVNTRFNLDKNIKRGGESGSRQIGGVRISVETCGRD
jgi:hypothetical protein